MQNYKVGNVVHVLDSVEFEHILPNGAVKITQAAADALSAPIPETPAQADARKDAQINAEFGDAARLLTETLVMAIQDGSITTKTPNDIITDAKATRKGEL